MQVSFIANGDLTDCINDTAMPVITRVVDDHMEALWFLRPPSTGIPTGTKDTLVLMEGNARRVSCPRQEISKGGSESIHVICRKPTLWLKQLSDSLWANTTTSIHQAFVGSCWKKHMCVGLLWDNMGALPDEC